MRAKVLVAMSGITLLSTLAAPIWPAAQEQGQQSEPAGSLKASAQAPLPLINQPLVPDAAAPGGSGFTFTLNGSGFVNGSSVNWNGSPRATKFVDADRLTATIEARDIRAAGTGRVSVVNPGPGGGKSNVVFFPVTNPTATVLFAGSSLPTRNEPIQVAVGDFNNDGKLDMAVVNFNCRFSPIYTCKGPGSISIFLGTGAGTFQSKGAFVVGLGPTYAVVGDFNGDGKLDLATANADDNTVSILLGKGDGTFQPATAYPVSLYSTALAAADFNRDGKLDLAVNDGGSDTVSILLGNGDGTFQTHVDYATGSMPQDVAVGDYNQDGKLDLAVNDLNCANPPSCGPGMVSILLGNGDGTFQTHVEYTTGPSPDSVTAGDLNGDGILDLVTASGTYGANDTVSVLLGNGDGTFQPNVDYTTGTAPTFVALGDFNGDRKIDLAVANAGSNSVSILLGKGDGTFRPHIDFAAGTTANGIAAGDFNGDGRLDLAVADLSSANTVFVLLQTPPGQVLPPGSGGR